MELIISYVLPSIIIIIFVILIAYFFPYINAVWLKPSMLIWGYLKGKKKRKIFLNYMNPNKGKNELLNQNKNPEKDGLIILNNMLEAEEKNIKGAHDEEIENLISRISILEQKQKEKRNEFLNWRKNMDSGYWGRKFYALEKKFKEISLQNFLLIFVIIGIVFIDALIARHIFISLGLFTAEKLRIGKIEFAGGYPVIYGAFLTVILAIFLHVALSIKKLKEFFHMHKIGKISVFVIIFSLFILLLLSVLVPSAAKDLIEVAIRISWLIGVIAIYWIGEQIIGEKREYWQFLLPIIIILMIFGYIFSGIGFFIGLFIGKLINVLSETLFGLKNVRLNRTKINENIRYPSLRKGHRHGFFG